MSAHRSPTLAVTGLSKTFVGQHALRGVDLELSRGEVHALLGQNGSGKSTLIKILAGYHQPDPGSTATSNGVPLDLGDPAAAHAAGIRFIHQDLGLIGDLDVVDNLALGETYSGRWWLSDRRERSVARRLLREYEVDLDVRRPVRTLPPAQQTMLAIVRAIGSGIGEGGLLVLDEPTASLPNQDVQHLFALIHRITARGGTVLYVTHRLPEVFDIADRVTVLRDGRRIVTESVSELDHDPLVEHIIGRPLEAVAVQTAPPRAETALEVEHLAGGALEDVSFTVNAGEILGVTGLVGEGYESLLRLIFDGGASADRSGTVSIAGESPLDGCDPHASIAAGLAFAPSDRKRLSALPEWTLRENLTLPQLRGAGVLRWLAAARERADARTWLNRLEVMPAMPERAFASLSGGNQQKVVLARWLRCGARVFLLDEPTAGVDVGSKFAIYENLAGVAAGGAGVVIASSDPEELCTVCDRVLVLRNGRIAATLSGERLNPTALAYEVIRDDARASHVQTIDQGKALHA